MSGLTEEEKLIVGMFGTGSRLITVSKIRAAAADVEAGELRDLMMRAADKLLRMTEREYRQQPGSLIP